MAFNGMIYTADGLDLLAGTQLGDSINITKVSIGDGSTNVDHEKMHSLSHRLYDVVPVMHRKDNEVYLDVDITSMDQAGYYFREIGIIATGKDGSDVLLVYDNAGDDAEYIVPVDSGIAYEKRLRFILTISNQLKVTVPINGSIYALQTDLEKTQDVVEKHTTDSIIHVTQANKDKWDDAYKKRHEHSNKSIIDKLTQIMLDNLASAYTHISDTVKHITSAERSRWNNTYTKTETDAKDKTINDALSNHKNDAVSHVTQANKNVWNDKYTKAETDAKVKTVNDALTSHKNDAVSHVTQANKNLWNDKYTKNEVDNKLSALETKIDWKEAVATFADIAKTYPNPQDGWTVNTKDTDYTYRWTGSAWVAISANSIPKATQSVDGLLAKEDKKKLDDNTNARHTHTNKSILDKVTQVIIDNVMYFTDEEVTE